MTATIPGNIAQGCSSLRQSSFALPKCPAVPPLQVSLTWSQPHAQPDQGVGKGGLLSLQMPWSQTSPQPRQEAASREGVWRVSTSNCCQSGPSPSSAIWRLSAAEGRVGERSPPLQGPLHSLGLVGLGQVCTAGGAILWQGYSAGRQTLKWPGSCRQKLQSWATPGFSCTGNCGCRVSSQSSRTP